MAPVLRVPTGVTSRRAVIATLAVMCAAVPVFAGEPDRQTEQLPKPTRVEIPLPPGMQAPPIDKAIESLSRLRLRPAQNGLDVSETAHRPAERGSE